MCLDLCSRRSHQKCGSPSFPTISQCVISTPSLTRLFFVRELRVNQVCPHLLSTFLGLVWSLDSKRTPQTITETFHQKYTCLALARWLSAGAFAHTPKDDKLIPSGRVPRFWVRSLVVACKRGNQSMFFFLSGENKKIKIHLSSLTTRASDFSFSVDLFLIPKDILT